MNTYVIDKKQKPDISKREQILSGFKQCKGAHAILLWNEEKNMFIAYDNNCLEFPIFTEWFDREIKKSKKIKNDNNKS